MKRRFFLFAAPAIVAAPSLMKISALVMPQATVYAEYEGFRLLRLNPEFVLNALMVDRERVYGELQRVTGISSLMLGAQSA